MKIKKAATAFVSLGTTEALGSSVLDHDPGMFQRLTNLFFGEVEEVAAELNGPKPCMTEADEEGWMIVNLPGKSERTGQRLRELGSRWRSPGRGGTPAGTLRKCGRTAEPTTLFSPKMLISSGFWDDVRLVLNLNSRLYVTDVIIRSKGRLD